MPPDTRPDDIALQFSCADQTLYGVLSPGAAGATRGVLVIVGGPQYRAGSHRQFTLLARDLAARGIPVLRFDYRGMGDAEGKLHTFEMVDADVRAAIDAFQAQLPALREVVLWGLCDGASAAMLYAARDARVAALVALNPWVRTEAGLAKATLKHYYTARLRDPQFWRKLASGRFNARAAARSLLAMLRKARGHGVAAAGPAPQEQAMPAASLPERMAEGLRRFSGPVLLILSGADLTAREFEDTVRASPAWRARLQDRRVTQRRLDAANHTFSRREWRDQVAQWTAEWVSSW
jgi:exosortase A-associated hydrolase 1